MTTQKNIVILGGSYAGIQTAHYLLKHTIPALPSPSTYKVTLVNPSSQFWHAITGPRAILSDDLIDPTKTFLDIASAFKQYTAFTFIEGEAVNVDTTSQKVLVTTTNGASEELEYYALVIATGGKTTSKLFSPYPSISALRASWKDFRAQLSTAKTVVVGGGGPTGVEVAGEVAEHLNGSPGLFRPLTKKAEVILVTSAPQLLPALRQDAAARADQYLRRLGVNIRYNTPIIAVTASTSGQTTVTLGSSGELITADIYIPAMGITPSSSFLPSSILSDKGQVITDSKTLRVEQAGPRVYALGDVSTSSPGGLFAITHQVPVLATNLKRDLVADAAGKEAPRTGKDREFEVDTRASQFVPIGKRKGVGQLFDWWLPSWFIWAMKGRDYLTWRAKSVVSGGTMSKESVWKFE